MLDETIPKYKYWKADAGMANLEDRAEGTSIPYLWGHKHDIVPVCINTATLTYKICHKISNDRDALASIDLVEADDVAIATPADYIPDLVNGEFIVQGSPYLVAATDYYFVIYGTYTIDGIHFLYTIGDQYQRYADGVRYTIDGAGVWTANPNNASLGFRIWGKEQLDGEEELMIQLGYEVPEAVNIRDVAARTRIAQKFKTLTKSFYLTRIAVPFVKAGVVAPSGTIYLKILSNNNPETQVAIVSKSRDCSELELSWYDLFWIVRGTPTKIVVQATSPINKVRDIIEEVYEHVLGGNPVTDFVTADFDALDAAKTQPLDIYLTQELKFKQFLENLETGQLFKFLPTIDRKYTVKFGASGPGTGTLHFHDEDFLSFSMARNWKAVYQRIKVKYGDKANTVEEWENVSYDSEIADFIYKRRETLNLETYLSLKTDNQICAQAYRTLLEYPLLTATFEVAGASGSQLVPFNKVKLSRTRADYPGGYLDGVLFLIMEVDKNFIAGTTKVTAILDTQTYI